MVYLINFGDVGEFAHSPHFKRMPIGLATAGLISAGAALLGHGANIAMQERSNRKNIENQNALYDKQKQYQNFLNANGMLIQRQSMQRAGFNPNAEFGTSANLQSPTPSKSDVVAPQVDTSAMQQMLQQLPTQEAEIKGKHASTKAQEIENQRKASEDATLYNLDIIASAKKAESEGKPVTDLPELKVAPFNAGSIKALRDYSAMQVEKSNNEFSILQNTFKTLVTNKQIENSEVVDKMAQIPAKEFDLLFNRVAEVAQHTSLMKSEGELADSKKKLADLEEELTRNSDVHAIITKYLGNSSVADAVHAIVAVFQVITGGVSFSHKF